MESERGNKPFASLKPKAAAFSAAEQRVQEIYTPKELVGRIIEKGFSSSTSSNSLKPSVISFPQHTALSFPVARHRSHGPHWIPLYAASELKEDDLADDKDETDYAPISAFASPIERKEKKGLDFSRWRDLVSRGDSNSSAFQPNKKDTIPPEEKKKKISTTFSTGIDESFIETSVDVKRAKPSSNGVCLNGESGMQFSQSNGLKSDSGKEKLGRETDMLMTSIQGYGSTMDDIHAENSALLNQMSLQEIADAQSEILEKMNPAMIEILKKRGRDKLGTRKFCASEQENGCQDMVSGHLLDSGKNLGNDNVRSELPSEGFNSSKMAVMDTDLGPVGQSYSNSWKTWSERVEKVRELRFSLEGNVLEFDSHQVSSGCELGGVPPCVGSVAERDFLRTEGDPAALGYSIKEVIELIRSMVPAQRALALKLLDSILNKAQLNLLHAEDDTKIDWQAIWAYVLGPEPQIALSLRMALDDNHQSVVLACAKVIQSILSCVMNDNCFNISEGIPTAQKVLCTAPVFRSRSEIDSGFVQGGYWKYSTKPSNILPSSVDNEDEGVEERTIQDDFVVAGQDISAGFVRMGILSRICFLLEMEPIPALVECLISVLIGLARHSPTCTNAIIQCPRLVQNIVSIPTRQDMMELPCQIKAIKMLRVLSQMDKILCSNFVKGGVFQQVMWHWYRRPITIDQWVQSGKEHCKLTAALMVEQLRLWKVCISYGYCAAYFADFFPHMCLWLSRPTFSRLLELNVLEEFAYITREAYLTLGALSELLPSLHSMDQLNKQRIDIEDNDLQSWSWSHAVPVVDFAISWLTLKEIPYVSSIIHSIELKSIHNLSASSIIWVISAVLHMLYCVFDRISPRSADDENDSTSLPWLPEFVPKVCIEIVKNRFFSFSGLSDIDQGVDGYSLVHGLCYLNHQENIDVSLSSLSCLHGLIQLASSVDKCIQRARNACDIELLTGSISKIDDKILVEGMIKCAKEDLSRVLGAFGNLVSSKWQMVQSSETFGRGGPAPGVGVGWGSPAGGFWSLNILQARTAAQLVLALIKILPIIHEGDITSVEVIKPALQSVNCVLAVCLVAGPGDRFILEEALSILFQPLVLKYLDLFLHNFLNLHNKLKSFKWQYEENDYFCFSKILSSHFRTRWLSVKTKSSGVADKNNHTHKFPRNGAVLDTVHEAHENEEMSEFSFIDTASSSFCTPWAHQRLPVPIHWFLSAICGIGELKYSDVNSLNKLDVAKGGLFFLLCLEALSQTMFPDQESPVLNVSFVWKLHALSMSLHANMAVLEEEKTRDIFESLQELYGKQLDEMRCKKKHEFQDSSIFLSRTHDNPSVLLSFQSQINEGYSTFVENLVEQYGAVSYGDIIFGRQVAIYLHPTVDIPVRLATWNALSNAHLLELLPPLEFCFSEAEGYLEPPEDNEAILEAYAKSWTSGLLDRAFTRGSVGFSLALHHLHSFVFKSAAAGMLKLCNKLTKSLLRSYSHKRDNNGMLLHLLQYKLPMPRDPLHSAEILQRFELLKAACEGNSSLLNIVESLRSAL